MLRSTAVAVLAAALLLLAARAEARRSEGQTQNWTVQATVSGFNIVIPSALLSFERALGRRFGIQLSGGGGLFGYEARLSAQVYFLDDFRDGFHFGLEGRSYFTNEARHTVPFALAAAFIGYKKIFEAGFTIGGRLGAWAIVYMAGLDDKDEQGGGVDMSGAPFGLTVDLFAGYSF
jgi:hypothetical protein